MIAVHTIWREKNNHMRGEENPLTASAIGNNIDKNIRNRITLLQKQGNPKYGNLFVFWLSTRILIISLSLNFLSKKSNKMHLM